MAAAFPTHTDEKAAFARAYAERFGLSLFLVAADCRTPLVEEGWFEHGVHDATSDVGEILRRLKRRPGANLAAACGAASGVVVVDVDVKEGQRGRESLARLEADYAPLPLSWESVTPSGGSHLWFRQPADKPLRNRVNLYVDQPDGRRIRYAGIDIRSTGGSVAVPPSRKPNGAYRWKVSPSAAPLADAPDWLLRIIDPPYAAPPAKPLRLSSLDRTARYVEKAVDEECGELAGMGPNTGRNLRLFQAAAKLGSLVGANLLRQDAAEAALERAAAECGLTREDGPHAVRASIASGMRRGISNPREVRV